VISNINSGIPMFHLNTERGIGGSGSGGGGAVVR